MIGGIPHIGKGPQTNIFKGYDSFKVWLCKVKVIKKSNKDSNL